MKPGDVSLEITLRHLRVDYPEFTLGPLDLDFQPGERVALVGANGAGKSTLLKAVAGRMNDYRGTVTVGGTEVRSSLPGIRASIGFLPERLLGFGWLTVGEHLRFLSNFYPTWDDVHATALADRLGLPLNSKVGTLSKGMAVKLSLVAAEAFRPPVLVLDEPTSSIDPVMRGELLQVINESAPEGGHRLILYSTHILEDVEHFADRVVLLRDGRVVGDMSAAEVGGRDSTTPMSTNLYTLLRSTDE